MRARRSHLLIFALIIVAFVLQCSSLRHKPIRVERVADWESIFFKSINRAVELSKVQELRDTSLAKGEFEVRIWRPFSLDEYEGVTVAFKDEHWTAFHISEEGPRQPHKVVPLPTPKSGWKSFWNRLVELELLTMPNVDTEECKGTIDGMGLVVESSVEGNYRTFMYPFRASECEGSRNAEAISDYIGMEFHDGIEKCTKYQWFACASVNRTRTLETERSN